MEDQPSSSRFSPSKFAELAQIALDNGQLVNAGIAIEEALTAQPNNIAWLTIAWNVAEQSDDTNATLMIGARLSPLLRRHGPDDAFVTLQENLSTLYRRRGWTKAALDAGLDVLRMREPMLDDDNIAVEVKADLIQYLVGLAELTQGVEGNTQAAEHYTRAAALATRLFSSEDNDTALIGASVLTPILDVLRAHHAEEGDLDKAIAVTQRAIAAHTLIDQLLDGDRAAHLARCAAWKTLGDYQLRKRSPGAAKDAFVACVDACTLREQSADVRAVHISALIALAEQGEGAEALDLLLRGLALAEQADDPMAQWQLHHQTGNTLTALGRADEAWEQHVQAQDCARAMLKKDPLCGAELAWTHMALGDLNAAEGMLGDALEDYEEALAHRQKVRSRNARRVTRADFRASLRALGALSERMGRTTEAEGYLNRAQR